MDLQKVLSMDGLGRKPEYPLRGYAAGCRNSLGYTGKTGYFDCLKNPWKTERAAGWPPVC